MTSSADKSGQELPVDSKAKCDMNSGRGRAGRLAERRQLQTASAEFVSVTWRGFGRQVEVGSIGGDGEGSCASHRRSSLA
jgi:hypothetical protein